MEAEDAGEQVGARFEKFEDDFLKFKEVSEPNRLHARPDICAFLILDRIVPSNDRMIGAAKHDVIYLNVDTDVLAEKATDDEIRDLHRCGVLYSEENDGLIMFR